MHDSEYWERVVRSEMKAFKFNSVQIEMGRKEYEILVQSISKDNQKFLKILSLLQL